MLSDVDIKKALESKDIIIEPLDFKDIQPSSVDLRVGYDFRIFLNLTPFINLKYYQQKNFIVLVQSLKHEKINIISHSFINNRSRLRSSCVNARIQLRGDD